VEEVTNTVWPLDRHTGSLGASAGLEASRSNGCPACTRFDSMYGWEYFDIM
jgi:hypothetical protein